MGYLAIISAVGQGLLGASSVRAGQEAALEQSEADLAESERQHKAINDQARAAKSDRARRAAKDLASASAALEGSSDHTLGRITAEVQGNLGLDLARIEGNRAQRTGAIRSSASNTLGTINAALDSQATDLIGGAFGGGGANAVSELHRERQRRDEIERLKFGSQENPRLTTAQATAPSTVARNGRGR